MPSTSTTLSARESPVSRAGLGCEQAPLPAARGPRSVRRRHEFSAGVAQLVERQPSKLNVASSSLVSRSVFISGFWGPNPKTGPACGVVAGLSASGPNPKTGPACGVVAGLSASGRTPETGPACGVVAGLSASGRTPETAPVWGWLRVFGGLALASSRLRLGGWGFGNRSCFAHLAQLVEHVLGKDEVTSSILVVGSKRLRHAVPLAFVTTEPATH
jgi:hypothetical protein